MAEVLSSGFIAPARGDGLGITVGGPPLTFLPEAFFRGRTEGLGLVRTADGGVRRCRVITEGVPEAAYDALHFTETFAYDDGETDVWRWAMARGTDGRYVASESLAGSGLIGRIERGDYVIAFSRPMAAGRPFPAFRYRTRFTLLAPDTALKTVRIGLFGLTLGTMTAYHHRV